MDKVYEQIAQEELRQIDKWGEQNHPSVDPILYYRTGERRCNEYEIPSEERAKVLCDINAKRGTLTWSHIAIEEMSEAVSARNENLRREELVQLAAVVISWIKSIDRNSNG